VLVLTRKIGEGIRIDKNVVVKVLTISGGQVKLGIEADKSVRVMRDEIPYTCVASMDQVIS